MVKNKELDEADFEEFDKLGALSNKTTADRDRIFAQFNEFLLKYKVAEGGGAEGLAELFKTQEGRDKFTKYYSAFFFTIRVREEEWPKLAYAESIRSHIKNKILKDVGFDIANAENFPGTEANWRKYTMKLTQEGKSVTKHKEEIPPATVNDLWMLFKNVQSALENRSSDNYVSFFLDKIDTDLHNKLNKIMMLGAIYLVTFYEVRRGQEGLEFLQQSDFQLVEDETFQYKYYKKFRSEQDKNHQDLGTNVACSGVMPFTEILLDDGVTTFNPGSFFGLYLSFLPPEATKAGCKGGYLFQRVRKISKLFDIHNPSEMTLYEANSKGGLGVDGMSLDYFQFTSLQFGQTVQKSNLIP